MKRREFVIAVEGLRIEPDLARWTSKGGFCRHGDQNL